MASYITHNIKGLPSGYNLMCWIMVMPGVLVVAAVVDGGSPESAATPTTSPSSVPTGLRQRDHKGGCRNSDGGRRRRDQPCKEKQASKKMSSANNTNSSDSNGPGNGDALCLMVSVVEPMISLAPEAIDDFNLTVKGHVTVALQGEAGKQVLVPYVLYVPGVQANLFLAGQLKDSGVRLQDDDDEMLLVLAVGDVHSALHRPSPLHQPSPLLDDVDIEVDGGGGSADDLVGKFMGKKFTNFVDGKGIVHNLTSSYTPQKNGMAELERRTVIEDVQTMLLHMGVQHHWWHLAQLQAVWVHICLERSTLPIVTKPYQLLTGKKLDLMLACA
ncbi:unnamed protein product [Closterium sp. NIES-54]